VSADLQGSIGIALIILAYFIGLRITRRR